MGCWIRSPSGPRREHVHIPLGPHVVTWGPIGHCASLEHAIVSGGAKALVLAMQCVPSRAAHPKFPGSVTVNVASKRVSAGALTYMARSPSRSNEMRNGLRNPHA